MSSVTQKLTAYAAYHRDGRNILAHMLGIPLIVLAVAILLSRPPIRGLALTPAMLVAALAAIYYLVLDLALGAALTIVLALACWAGLALAHLPTATWLASGIGGFIAGWVIQFIGHGFEGRKPAFFDDLISLAIGPLFIMAEIFLLLGLRRPPPDGSHAPPC